jgi:hypothetical protein
LHIDDIAILNFCIADSCFGIQPFAIKDEPTNLFLVNLSDLFEARHDLADQGSGSNFQSHRLKAGAVQYELDIGLFPRPRLPYLFQWQAFIAIRCVGKPILFLLDSLPFREDIFCHGFNLDFILTQIRVLFIAI